ncbi:solute symporter family protein [Paraburkholderia caballeronis]|uniref:Cation/acetate symporter n=1 Tax=Paraburkholderia caballeronis TaxID=416943 RepID=A0A1H7FFW5_9BURK|nr:cation/acetate symporter ActP [Paraburkholderia caballeronis]PXW24046.1 cation/acetate symporter [Paraburkholderia caballeronis]PXW99810.1 cation/acetate symporter [Paraburkholderia caballeronis]RAJ96764.1 cation/acetate symporter [Paraburkholderia caballeronis]TDV26827.1 cation/acetate symporter [Paraburkholderia caballeronis]SEE75033.1 cation/acetate symporter [Paraburkholderia caballeronis]
MNGQRISAMSVGFFFAFLLATICITVFASRRSRSASEYFNAGGRVSALQNGLAMAGEYLSAAALLGMTGAISLKGFDGVVYSIGVFLGWPLILFLVSEPVKRLGKFTLADVIAWRLRAKPIRIAVALASLPIVLLYLITQLVAAGGLIKLMFGIAYLPAVVLVGIIMLCYVFFGGMLGTTWVQIIKAVLLFAGSAVLVVLLLAKFGFHPSAIFVAAAQQADPSITAPHVLASLDRWDTLSLAVALVFGALGMPQILTRFLTVANARDARRSAFYATSLVGVFHIFVLTLGFGALALIGKHDIVAAGGAGNMAVPLLARLLGGDAFFGFICAVSFATMLAVVAGLTLSAATTFAHDIWAGVVMSHTDGGVQRQPQVARAAAVVVAVASVLLALRFEGQNVAFMVGLSYSIAASANFPVLMLALYWRRLTTAGAVAGMLAGAAAAVLLIVLSPTIQVEVLHRAVADVAGRWWFVPLRNPCIVSLPFALFVACAVSLLRPQTSEQAGYARMHAVLEG